MNTRHTGSPAPVNSRVAAFSAASFTLSRTARAVAAALPLLGASAAFAQVAADSPAQQVVVTAARVEQKLPDTLPSTTVISRSDIEA
jgi:outer membrane cobalamin receptor